MYRLQELQLWSLRVRGEDIEESFYDRGEQQFGWLFAMRGAQPCKQWDLDFQARKLSFSFLSG